MFHTILVPLDGSEFGDYAVPTARAIAERAGAALHLALVHVPVYSAYVEGTAIIDPELDQASRANDHAYLQAVQQRLSADGGPTTTVTVLDGPVAETLAGYATQINADLVVMTTHGRGGLARFWLGSVADGLVRHSTVPVLLIRPDDASTAAAQTQPRAIKRMLVALDGSPLAEDMLASAMALGSVFDVDYTFIQVVDAIVVTSSPMMMDHGQREYAVLRQREAQARRYLETVAAPLRAEGYRIATEALVDPQPALAILRAARAQGSDVIALATHGYGGARRLLLGSVADKVLRGADRPVLVYRPQPAPRQDHPAPV